MIRSTTLRTLCKSMAGLFVFLSSLAFAADSSLLPEPRELVLLNWSEYIDPDLVEKFETQFNANLREVYFESDDLRDELKKPDINEIFEIGLHQFIGDYIRKNNELGMQIEKDYRFN